MDKAALVMKQLEEDIKLKNDAPKISLMIKSLKYEKTNSKIYTNISYQ